MKTDWVIERLEGARGDARALREVARDLGWEMPRRRREVLADYRRRAARLPRAGDAYAQGFRDALLELVTAFQRAIDEDEDRDQAVQLAVKRSWLPILRHLMDAPSTPSQLARTLGKDISRISVLLKEIRGAGLAESVDPGVDADGRSKLHLLTPRGLDVVRALDLPSWVEPSLDLTVECIRRLLLAGSLHRRALEEMAERALGPLGVEPEAVARRLLERCDAERVLVEAAGRWVPSPTAREVRAQIKRAVAEPDFEPSFMRTLERNATARSLPLVVRASEAAPWNVFLAKGHRREYHLLAGWEVDAVDQAHTDNLLAGQRFGLLYESPALRLHDEAAGTAAPLLARARKCYVFAGEGDAVEAPLVGIPVERGLAEVLT